jgi:hypothetical protein
MNREGKDLRRSFGVFGIVGRRCECFRYTVSVVYIQVEVHDSRTSPLDAGLGEQQNPEDDVGDVAKSTCSAALCVMSASVPIDSDIGLAVGQELTGGACCCSHQGYVVGQSGKHWAVLSCQLPFWPSERRTYMGETILFVVAIVLCTFL